MKKYKLILIAFFGIIISCTDKAEKSNSNKLTPNENQANPPEQIVSDTFSFENPFGEEPLLLKKETLESVKGLLGDTSTIKIEGPKAIPDFETELIVFSKDSSSITTFNNSARTGMIIYSADIRDTLPIFKNNVIVGMTKQELIRIFKLPKESAKAKVFEIYYGEATSYVYLIFESDRLKSILFWPYTG